MSLPADKFSAFKSHLDTITFLKDIRLNIAREQDNKSFLKLKIKVKNKIVADGLDDETFDANSEPTILAPPFSFFFALLIFFHITVLHNLPFLL